MFHYGAPAIRPRILPNHQTWAANCKAFHARQKTKVFTGLTVNLSHGQVVTWSNAIRWWSTRHKLTTPHHAVNSSQSRKQNN